MGKGGGGGVDTSGLEEATAQATALQRQIYEQTREDVQPWYKMGVGAVGKLSDLLGIEGGSIRSRGDIYDELLPQFTTQEQYQEQTGSNPSLFINDMGQVSDSHFGNKSNSRQIGSGEPIYETRTRDVIDYDALNAAVEERLGSQTTPENYGSLLERFDLTKFEEDPSYQFRQDEAQKALERRMAAQGVTLGGGGYGEINPQVARALDEQTQNLASQEYQSAYNRYVNDQLNTYNMLTGAAGMGQNSTGIMANTGQSYATNVGNLTTGLAGAQLNAQMASAAQPSMFDSLLGTATTLGSAYLTGGGSLFSSPETWASGAAFLSDERLKENIELVRMQGDIPIYHFNYKDGEKRYEGVMAQDIEKIMPDAVHDIDGYLAVDYGKLGLEMVEVTNGV